MNKYHKIDTIKCIHCGEYRNLTEQTYCSHCGGRELWQSKPRSQKNIIEIVLEKIIKWSSNSITKTFLVVFIITPLVFVLALRLLGLLLGFEIIF